MLLLSFAGRQLFQYPRRRSCRPEALESTPVIDFFGMQYNVPVVEHLGTGR